ncbi:hypothetical protein DFH06DRAFT_1118551 [Mycena polygramma]|nr:hypothetical protein DFH06DRAFT_1118551 [Mycena polygramma]
MSSDRANSTVEEHPSTTRTEFYSAPNTTGLGPDGNPIPPVSDVAPRQQSRPGSSVSRAASNDNARYHEPTAPTMTLMRGADGVAFAIDNNGVRFGINSPTPGARNYEPGSTPSHVDEAVPIHHSTLFPQGSDAGEVSTESVLSESTPQEGTAVEYPELELDIDPELLNNDQIAQLNAIRGHMGTTQSRLLATTALMAETTTTTEMIQEDLIVFRAETVSRIDSLRNEVHTQRSRLNRCLDDNLRILRDTGASSAQIQNILRTMSKTTSSKGRAPMATSVAMQSIVHSKETLPDEVRTSMYATIPPRTSDESAEDFEKRAHAVLRAKENAHAAFPLPKDITEASATSTNVQDARKAPNVQNPDHLHRAARFGVLPSAEEYQSVGSASRAGIAQQISHARKWRGAREMNQMNPMQDVPVVMNNSASAYVSGREGVNKDLLTAFTDNAVDSIRELIENKLGNRLELPSNVRTPKVAEPVKYRGEDDHDYFMVVFLEKLIGWLMAGNYGGDDLDAYRVVLLQSYLEGEAHRWYVSEVNEYSKIHRGETPEFADVLCALYQRFVKSSSAQRATRAFDNVQYDPKRGPEKLHTDLTDKARQMVEAPSALAIRHRFMNLIPKWISKDMKIRRGLTAEFASLEGLRVHARQMWEADLAIKEEEAAATSALAASGTPPPPPFRARRDRNQAEDRRPGRAEQPKREYGKSDANPGHARESRESDRLPRSDNAPRSSNTKTCYSCGGNHYARDKECPNYSEAHVKHHDKARVQAHRVLESFSDEDTQSEDYTSTEESESNHENESPDLDDLLAAAQQEEVRLAAMRDRPHVRYYAMRIVTEDEESVPEDTEDDESSVTTESLTDTMGSEHSAEPAETLPRLGNYNPGPACVVCRECALVIRQVAATEANGLLTDHEYTVCEHLANVGIASDVPDSPSLNGSDHSESCTNDRVPEADVAPSPADFDGIPLNHLGDPDFEPGTIIDITEPASMYPSSAEEEVQMHDRTRTQSGLRPLTALEYDVNLRWLRRFRIYPDPEEDAMLNEYIERSDAELRTHPTYGPLARARDVLEEMTLARQDEARVANRGPFTPFSLSPELTRAATELGYRSRAHRLRLQAQDRLAQSVVTRRLAQQANERMGRITAEIRDPLLSGRTEELWEQARHENMELSGRVSYALTRLQDEREALIREAHEAESDAANTERIDALLGRTWTHTPTVVNDRGGPISVTTPPNWPPARLNLTVEGQENLGALPLDEAQLWADSLPFSSSDLADLREAAVTGSPVVDNDTATEPGDQGEDPDSEEEYNRQAGTGYTWAQEQARHDQAVDDAQPRSWLWASEMAHRFEYHRASRLVDDETSSSEATTISGLPSTTRPTTSEDTVHAQPTDEIILKSVRMHGPREAEQVLTLVDHSGNVYWKSVELPQHHYLHPNFRQEHEDALETAIRARRQQLDDPYYEGTEYTSWVASTEGHDRRGARLIEDPRSDCATQGTQYDTVRLRRKIDIEEIDEEEDLSARLPADHPFVLECESVFSGNPPLPDEAQEPERRSAPAHPEPTTPLSESEESDEEYYDAEDLACPYCDSPQEAEPPPPTPAPPVRNDGITCQTSPPTQ